MGVDFLWGGVLTKGACKKVERERIRQRKKLSEDLPGDQEHEWHQKQCPSSILHHRGLSQ